MGALDGWAPDWDIEMQEAREALRYDPGVDMPRENIEFCVNSLIKNYGGKQNKSNKFSAEYIWTGMNQLFLTDEMHSCFAISEELPLYESMGRMMVNGSVGRYRGKHYSKDEVSEMRTADAVSTLVSLAFGNNPVLYNEVVRRQGFTPEKNSMKDRISSLNIIQQSAIKEQFGKDYWPSIQEGNLLGWHHPGRERDARGGSTKQYVSLIQRNLRNS